MRKLTIFQNPPVRITLVYVVVSAIWLLTSDGLLFSLGLNETTVAGLGLLKAFAFVGVTGSVLYAHVSAEFRVRDRLECDLNRHIEEVNRAHAILAQSEERFRRAVEEAPLPIFLTAEDGEILSVSRAALEISGYSREQIGTVDDWTDLVYPDPEKKQAVRAAIRRLYALERPIDEGDFTITCHDEQQRIWNFSTTPLGRQADGRRLVISMASDVTERRQMEDELRESRLRFRQLAENINEVFYLSDPDKEHMLYISPAYETIWGRSCESLYQNPRSFLDGIHPDDRQRVIETFEKQQRGEPSEVVYRVTRPDYEVHWIRSRAFPVPGENGGTHRVAGIAEDITERVKYQARLKRLSQRLVTVMDEERARIARELHDQIGQELTGLGINMSVVAMHCGPDSPVNDVVADSTELISTIIDRIRAIIADLRPVVLVDMGLAAGLRWYADRLARRTGLTVIYEGVTDDLSVSASADNTLYRIACEALTNVVRHAQAETVWIGLHTSSDRLTLTVRDDGRGFDLQQTMTDERAHSWGLRIMQERIQTLVGSRLTIDSQPGQGTLITAEIQL